MLDRYERALAGLGRKDQELLHLRIELDFDYGEIASMTEAAEPRRAAAPHGRATRTGPSGGSDGP
ncbi:MAG: hypothetical protein IPH86_19495 [bacterium]|nr:hypothetical protein [bacterium]